MKRVDLLLSVLWGGIFACGLAFAGMTQPQRVVGFLDVTGVWDPTLGVVMAGALAVFAPLAWGIGRRGVDRDGAPLDAAPSGGVDVRLIAGSALFGLGWGAAGYCPGPGLLAAVSGAADGLIFFASMLAGMWLWRMWPRRCSATHGAVGIR